MRKLYPRLILSIFLIIIEKFRAQMLLNSTFFITREDLLKENDKNNDTYFQDSSSIIFGNSSELSYYYLNLLIGDPPQLQSMIIDTGSELTAVPCKPYCKQCGTHNNKIYDMSQSNVSRVIQFESTICKENKFTKYNSSNGCRFHIDYEENSSLSGLLIEDKVSIQNPHYNFTAVPISFGCTTNETGMFYNQRVNGIIGLAPDKNSLISTYYNKSAISKHLFSLCLGDSGGYFSIGNINSTLHLEPVQYINYYGTKGYMIKLKEIIIDDNIIYTENEDLLSNIDSGSTFTYFPSKIFNHIENTFAEFCSQVNRCMGKKIKRSNLELCYELYENINVIQFYESMPNIIFTFENNIEYEWKPKEYLISSPKFAKPIYCVGINKWNKNKIIFGTTWMRDHDIIFNIQSKQIGFSSSSCSGLAQYKYIVKRDFFKFKFSIAIIVISFLLLIIIVLLFALRKLRRGQKFLWLKVGTDDSYTSTNNTLFDINRRLDEVHSI